MVPVEAEVMVPVGTEVMVPVGTGMMVPVGAEVMVPVGTPLPCRGGAGVGSVISQPLTQGQESTLHSGQSTPHPFPSPETTLYTHL